MHGRGTVRPSRIDTGRTTDYLRVQVAEWPTPMVDSFRSRGGERVQEAGLDRMARCWPTPDGSVMNDGESPEMFLARKEVNRAKHNNGNGIGTPLAMDVQMWPTPRASPNENRTTRHQPSVTSGRHGRSLAGETAEWPSPQERDWRSGLVSETTLGANSRPLNEAAVNWLPACPTTPPDETLTPLGRLLQTWTPPSCPQLNARFVEWLMGWPLGWTGFVRSATESTPWLPLSPSSRSGPSWLVNEVGAEVFADWWDATLEIVEWLIDVRTEGVEEESVEWVTWT